MAKDTLNLRYTQPATDMLGILHNLYLFNEFITGKQGGFLLMYRMMEYHLDAEVEDGNS